MILCLGWQWGCDAETVMAEIKHIYGFFSHKYFLIPIPVIYLTQNLF